MKRLDEGANEEGLTGAGRAVEKHAVRGFDFEGSGSWREKQGGVNHFLELANGLLEAAHTLGEESEGLGGEGGGGGGRRRNGRFDVVFVLKAELGLVGNCGEVEGRAARFGRKSVEIHTCDDSTDCHL